MLEIIFCLFTFSPSLDPFVYVIQLAFLGTLGFTEVIASLVICVRVLLILRDVSKISPAIRQTAIQLTLYTAAVTFLILLMVIITGLAAGSIANLRYSYELALAARLLEAATIVLVAWSVRPPVKAMFGGFGNTS